MSDTYKDKRKAKLKRYYKNRWDTEYYISANPYVFLEVAGVKTKKRKEADTEDHWMSTPSWWTSMTMNKPERRAWHLLERRALISDMEEFEIPDTGRKPHIYFW